MNIVKTNKPHWIHWHTVEPPGRRFMKYERTVEISFEVQLSDCPFSDLVSLGTIAKHIQLKLSLLLNDHFSPLKKRYDEMTAELRRRDDNSRRQWDVSWYADNRCQSKPGDDNITYAVWYVVTVHGPRPSQVPSQDEILAQLPESHAVEEAIKAALLEGTEIARAESERKQMVDDAYRIATHAFNYAHEEARKVTEYNQRLAALEAEYQAEIDAQIAKLDAEKLAEDWDMDPQAVRVGIAHSAKIAQASQAARAGTANLMRVIRDSPTTIPRITEDDL